VFVEAEPGALPASIARRHDGTSMIRNPEGDHRLKSVPLTSIME
jgi:hypothetical protein